MTNYPKILSAEYYRDLILKISFSDNSIKYYNFEILTSKEVFKKLTNLNYFKNFSIYSGGYGLVWDEDTDIAESELWQNGTSTP
ncbi:MAG: hypothetical protein A2X64_07510 [Ignavibacteria bacterium GWF2_33_9]|nr:MAG: hypothetical protein A2X64_07510 [Ignavibacteria bacterium GWF2_33_9]